MDNNSAKDLSSALPCTVCLCTYLCFKFIIEVGVIELNEAEEKGTFLGNRVVPGNVFLHIFLQEGHVAQEATCKGPQQLEQ